NHVIVDKPARGGLDIGGVLAVGQRGQVNAVGLAQAEFRHGANPAGDALLVAKVVDGPGRTQPAHALDLEVDDPTGSPADGLGGQFVGLGGLVEADRGAYRFLQPGQSVQVRRFHGLLEHEQVEFVQLAEDVDVGGRVGSVAIHHQGNLAEVLADRADKLDVASRLDLDLHTAISFGQMGLDGHEQF